MVESDTAVMEPEIYTSRKPAPTKPKQQPRYHVVLWDDPDHTFDYVIMMTQQLFGATLERAMQLAKEVDTSGKAVCLTTTKEHAELKRDQIHSFGKDPLLARCSGSMTASIEPEC